MADVKFSDFASGGATVSGDIVVGLRAGVNTQFTTAASGGGLLWSTIAGTTQAAAAGNGYIVGNASQTTITLPASFAIGDTIVIKGFGAAGWVLTANTGDIIRIGSSVTSAGGTVTSAGVYDVIRVSGLVANTTWSAEYCLTAGFTIA